MFIVALFTVAKTWKQPKCPSIGEWIKKMWYMHTVECYSAIKKNEIMPFASMWLDLEIIILNEVSQRKKYHMVSFTCGFLKYNTNKRIYKTEKDRHGKQAYGLPNGECGGRDKLVV